MPIEKLSDKIAKLVFDLEEQEKAPGEIAQILSLKKVQVSTILASKRLATSGTSERAEPEHEASEAQASAAPDLDNAHSGQPSAVDESKEAEPSPHAVYVGEDIDYQTPSYWEPADFQRVQNPHLMIMGESGSGKTYAAQSLVAELAQRGIPSILFDYGQSFELATLEKPFKKFTKIREHLISEDGLPINPLQIFPKDIQGPKNVATRVSEVFDAVYRLGDIQRKVVIDAIRIAFEKSGILETDSSTWQKEPPSLTAFQNTLDELASDRDYQNYKNATGVAARLVTFFMLITLRKQGEAWSWDSLLNDPDHNVQVLQFRGLEGKTQRVLVELLLWHLFYYLKAYGQSPLRLFVVLDEAHHLSFRESGPTDSLLREARKFGLGILFASQQPEDFSPAAFSNSASKLVFQTADPTLRVSKFLAQKCANYPQPEEIGKLISVLRQGEAFFITKNKGHLVKLADFKKRATLWVQK